MTRCKRIGSFILSLLLVLSMLSSTFAVQTFAATGPALSAESKTVSAGEQFTVAVSLANATSVYGGNFTLQYDSSLLSIGSNSYEFGSIVTGHTKNCNTNYQSAGNLIRVTFSGASAVTASGTLITFTFTAKENVSGTAALQFNAYKMYDQNGSAITSTASGSAITISSGPVVTPAISVTSKTVTIGDTVSVPVVISNSDDVYGGNFTLQYDSSLLTVDSYTFGSIVSGHTKNCNTDYQSAGNLIRVTFSGASAVSSDGTLITFTFTAKASGTATLKFNAYKMYDENGSAIATTASGSDVIILPKPNNIITGSCGTGVTGELNLDTGILTISGAGALWDHGDNYGVFSTYKESIRKIVINNGITRIGACNFDNYDLLEEVIIAESVVEIGARAFRDCDSLNTVIIPDSVTMIDFGCFSGCDNLTTVDLPNGISILNDSLFSGCPSLEMIIIPNSVVEIKYGVFSSTAIKSIDIPSSVQSIGGDAFLGCENLERITLNEGLLSIGKRAFIDCPKLLEICIPKSVVTIADDEWGHAFDLDTTIYGYRNSVAQTYAIELGNEFISLDLTELVAISVSALPTKTTYYIGDALNAAGLELLVTYSDGSGETVTSGFTTSGFSSTSAGTKTVTVSYEGFTDTFTVTVKTPSITLSASSETMSVGDTDTITATTTPSGQTVTWTSSNTSVATVSGGTITAKASGTATITAKFTYNGKTYSKTCSVTVEDVPVTPDLPDDAPAFVVENVSTHAGQEFTVAIRTERNSGVVSLKLNVSYDSNVLELMDAVEQDFDGTSFGPLTNTPFIVNWFDALRPNNTTNGVVALLTFRVKEGAPIGKTDITLSYDPADVFDQNYDNVAFRTENGSVEIVDYMLGDATGDGAVNNRDLAMMQQYINGWKVIVDEEACDVNVDGAINNRDLALLQQYINGWDVTLGKK